MECSIYQKSTCLQNYVLFSDIMSNEINDALDKDEGVFCPPVLCDKAEVLKYVHKDKKNWRANHRILREVNTN